MVMKMISSEVGERLAAARIRVVETDERFSVSETAGDYYAARDAHHEFLKVAREAADELIAQGFGNAEGD